MFLKCLTSLRFLIISIIQILLIIYILFGIILRLVNINLGAIDSIVILTLRIFTRYLFCSICIYKFIFVLFVYYFNTLVLCLSFLYFLSVPVVSTYFYFVVIHLIIIWFSLLWSDFHWGIVKTALGILLLILDLFWLFLHVNLYGI